MVTFVVKKKSVFFSQAAFQLFKFIQILFIYLPFSLLKGESSGPANRLPVALDHWSWDAHGWDVFYSNAEERQQICQEANPGLWEKTVY